MTIGEQLLNLTTEYQAAVQLWEDWGQQHDEGDFAGRAPAVIAAEYEQVLKELLLVPGAVVSTP
jgi:hypothetical protein